MQNGFLNLLKTSRQVASTALNSFVVDVAREGAIDFRPLHPALRVMLIFGFGLLGLFMVGILVGEQVRLWFPREILLPESSDVRTLTIPTPYVPLTLLAFTVGWGFILSGALYTRPLFRWLILFAYYIFFALNVVVESASAALGASGVTGFILFLFALLLNCLLFFTFLILPRFNTMRPLVWAWIMVLVATLTTTGYLLVVRTQAITNEFTSGNFLSGLITNLFILIVGFLLISGLGWIDFALQTSKWATDAVQQHASRFIVLLFLLILLGVRGIGMMQRVAQSGFDSNALLGACLLIAGVAGIGFLRRYFAPNGEVPYAFLMWFAVLIPAAQYLIYIVTRFAFVFLIFQIMRAETQQWTDQLADVTAHITEWEVLIRPFLMAGVGILIAFLARRRNGMLATFGLVVAWTQLLKWLMAYGRPLAAYRYEYADVDFVMVGLLLVLVLVGVFTNQLSRLRMLHLFAIAALMALLNQTDFLDNPFSPLFGSAGIAFFVFGTFWNVIDLAGLFVNKDTPGLPRDSRALLYIGYALLAVSVSHWFIASHNLIYQQYQNDLTYLAFMELGYPLAYTVILEGGRILVPTTSAPDETEDLALEPLPS
jgi:hypothetical protein